MAQVTLAQAAQSRLQALGMPRRNNELWSFFPVNKIPAPEFMKSEGATAGCCDAVAQNVVQSFDLNISEEQDFAALLPLANDARTMMKDVAAGDSEMGLIKCNDDFGHTVFNIGKNAKVSLEILDNKVLHEIAAERFDINIEEGAQVEIFFANPANEVPLRFRHFRIVQAANSVVRFSEIERGNGIARVSIDAYLKGEGARFEIRALNALQKNANVHHRLTIHHEVPNTESIQFARNLLDGHSYVSYDGSVIVNEGCTNTQSSQLVNTILLSDDSSVSVKPVLKIYHDDVECTHGNTCGELDNDQMFYLTSRGIPADKARTLLMKAFAQELFLPLPDSPAKKRLLQVLAEME